MSTSGVGYEQLNAPLKAMINAGGGGTGGAGGSFIVAPQFSTVKLTQASNTVNTNLSNFNKDFDTLLTFKNSVYIGQRDSYNIISNTQIQSSDKSNWEAGTTFQFVGLCVNRAPNVLKCISIKNKVELTTSSSFIDIGVRDFDQDADTLLLFENGVYMEKGLDYRIDGSKVYPMNDTSYKGTTDCPLIFNMIVLRNVVDPDAVKDFEGSNIKDLSITMNKLTQDIQNILNNPQDKRVGNMSLLKTSKKDTLVNSINELFQSASNGKTLVANAITGKGVQSNSNMTFQQLATNISNINTGYSREDIEQCKILVKMIFNNKKSQRYDSFYPEKSLNNSKFIIKKMTNTNYIFIQEITVVEGDNAFSPTAKFEPNGRIFIMDVNSGNIIYNNDNNYYDINIYGSAIDNSLMDNIDDYPLGRLSIEKDRNYAGGAVETIYCYTPNKTGIYYCDLTTEIGIRNIYYDKNTLNIYAIGWNRDKVASPLSQNYLFSVIIYPTQQISRL